MKKLVIELQGLYEDQNIPVINNAHVIVEVHKETRLNEVKQALKNAIYHAEVYGSGRIATVLSCDVLPNNISENEADKVTSKIYAAINRLKVCDVADYGYTRTKPYNGIKSDHTKIAVFTIHQ